MKHFPFTLLTAVLCSLGNPSSQAQIIHAHNDYQHTVPFWGALSAGCGSIEVDVVYLRDTLFVAHEPETIASDRTLASLYLNPLQHAIAFEFLTESIILLIDIKTEATTTLDAVIHEIRKLPKLIEAQRKGMVHFTISGNRPESKEWSVYPAFISFDYQSVEPISEDDLTKVSLLSLPFYAHSNWNGKEEMPREMRLDLQKVVDKAKSFRRPFRFWAIPDTPLSWQTMHELGVDYINTDRLISCVYHFQLQD